MRCEYQYRVTKYDPRNRNEDGHYLLDELVSFADVGKTFNGRMFSKEEYLTVEAAYVSSALAFLSEAEIDRLVLTGLWNAKNYSESGLDIREGTIYNLKECEKLFRLTLREIIGGKFGWLDEAYVHFGWDFYMYLGLPCDCPESIVYARAQGLFVEMCASPYLGQEHN